MAESLGRAAVAGFVAAVAAPALWIGYSALAVDHDVPLSPAIDAERRAFISNAGGLTSFYADERGTGAPLVLIHSINAAASAYEMKPLFEHYRGSRPVFAVDLPGFGFSERGPRAYTPELYATAIREFLEHVTRGAPADVAALSLSSELAAGAALAQPDLFRSLILISPTGLSSRANANAVERSAREGRADRVRRFLEVSLWRQPLYDLLVSRPSIAYYLQKSFAGPVDPTLKAYAYATSHRPGSRHAPFAFLSGALFTPDIREAVYERLKVPVLAVYDTDAHVSFEELDEVCWNNGLWRAARIAPTRGLPHFEQLDDVVRAVDAFLSEPRKSVPQHARV